MIIPCLEFLKIMILGMFFYEYNELIIMIVNIYMVPVSRFMLNFSVPAPVQLPGREYFHQASHTPVALALWPLIPLLQEDGSIFPRAFLG